MLGDGEVEVVNSKCDSKCGEDKLSRPCDDGQERRFIEWEMEPCLPISRQLSEANCTKYFAHVEVGVTSYSQGLICVHFYIHSDHIS